MQFRSRTDSCADGWSVLACPVLWGLRLGFFVVIWSFFGLFFFVNFLQTFIKYWREEEPVVVSISAVAFQKQPDGDKNLILATGIYLSVDLRDLDLWEDRDL